MEIVIFFLLAILTVGYFIWEIYRRFRWVKMGRAEDRSNRPLARWKYFCSSVFIHKKIKKNNPLFGIFHAFLMWGFLVLLISSMDMMITGLFHIRISWFEDNTVYILIRDLFIVLVILGVVGCVFRRLIWRPEWLNNNVMTFVILGLILVIVISELLFYADLPHHFAYTLTQVFWWTHFLAIFAFLLIIPHSKHLHLVFAALNTYWHTLEPKGALKPVQFEGEEEKVYGVGKLEDFTWKQLFDAFSCVKCGRCNGSCPAYQSGEELKPKRINGRLRKFIEKKASLSKNIKNQITALSNRLGKPEINKNSSKNSHDKIHQDKKSGENKSKKNQNKGNKIVGDIIEEEFLWSCTTCGSCMEACPVSCEHTSKIIDIRRYLVSSTERLSPKLTQIFQGIENYGNPWGIKRTKNTEETWMKELGIQTLVDKPNAEYFYFVGCAASSNELALKTTIAFAKILRRAGVDFAILGEEEWCCGETARRLGNELLFQKTAIRNITAWRNLGIKKILTTCPHCFNTLKNEYSQFGGDYEVIPHSAFLADLLHKGTLKPTKEQNTVTTYHDPCYLGRYNGFYEEQREILKAIPGVRLVEMPRTKEDSFCCGAGGGRFWTNAGSDNVISKNRVKEALTTGANVICTACPYCRIRLQEEIKCRELDVNINSIDIVEILEASL